jgi:hypothetical protein
MFTQKQVSMAFYGVFSLENKEGAEPPVLNAMRTTSNAKIEASRNFNQIVFPQRTVESLENAGRLSKLPNLSER